MQIPVQLTLPFTKSKAEIPEGSFSPIDISFPEEAANRLASLESFNKHLYRPNTYLHKWWARRSGTTFRHILKGLVGDLSKQHFYEPGGLEGKIILDPMAGGGTTLHEATRMGANVIGVDIDPVPVLQCKASLTWNPVRKKIRTFESFFKPLHGALASFFLTDCPVCDGPSEIQFTLYGLRRSCKCREILFMDSLILRESATGSSVELCSLCGGVHLTSQKECEDPLEGKCIQTRDTKECETCHAPYRDILEEPFSKRYYPVVIVGSCSKHGRFFKSLKGSDRERLEMASVVAQGLKFECTDKFRVLGGPKSDDLLKRNIDSYLDLFSPRQLIYLHNAFDLIAGFSPEDRLWLSLLISTSLEFNSLLCGYKGAERRRPGAIRHVFSHHAYSFPYTALENNPVFTGRTSGTLQRLVLDRVVRAGKWAMVPIEREIVGDKSIERKIHGEVDGGQPVSSMDELLEGTRRFWIFQGDSRKIPLPEDSIDHAITDPPYYDSVQYSDLSIMTICFCPQMRNESGIQNGVNRFRPVRVSPSPGTVQ